MLAEKLSGLINTVEFMSSVHGCFQRLARFKLGLIARRDMDGFAGARVAAGCCFTIRYRKGAEAYEANLITEPQEAGNSVEYTVDSLGCVGLRKASRI